MQKTVSHAAGAPKHTNALIDANSPYLLQHAHNPVNWYQFSEEAFTRARKENKPIFLSIGYSACHWCHVMERESFENEEIAEILNKYFINIKVDREERPDIDRIYMTAVQMMTGSGGWPMSVFLTPELEPFFGGTYFPPDSRYGRPGFKDLITRIAELWQTERDKIDADAAQMVGTLQKIANQANTASASLSNVPFAAAVHILSRSFDSEWGGFSRAPKFPPTGQIRFLLRQYRNTRDRALRDMAVVTLDRMAYGGMYDQLGGGFHRYSVDAHWLVPHFEKMLYDNALLTWAYLDAYQVTRNSEYRRIATETLDYTMREMTAPEGGFYSSEDADSEGVEGKYYVWTIQETSKILGTNDAELFNAYYGVTPSGNFEGHTILHVPSAPADFAGKRGMTREELQAKLSKLREKLRVVRDKRIHPGKDDKILTAWNGLMISAFARAYQVLDDERFLGAAERAAAFIMKDMYDDGVLYRTYRNGKTTIPGYLDDYAYMMLALVDVYQATFDPTWLDKARELADSLAKKFKDPKTSTFLYTSSSHSNLIARFKPSHDEAVPSGNAIATEGLLKLGILTGSAHYTSNAVEILKYFQQDMNRSPTAFNSMLCALDFYLDSPAEIALAGSVDDPEIKEMLRVIHKRYRPNKVVALTNPSFKKPTDTSARIPLLEGKTLQDGKPAAYVCKNFTCTAPVTSAAALEKTLDEFTVKNKPE